MSRRLSPHAPRQLSPEREEQLLAAAREAFFSCGVNAATMDDIARRAGVGKATIYRRYKTKEELFEAIILASAQKIAKELEGFGLDPDRPRASLREAARWIQRINKVPEHTHVVRQIIAEMPRQPELCRRARGLIVITLTQRLTDFFELLISLGRMEHGYPQQAATTFALFSGGGLRPLFDALDSKEVEQRRLDADLTMFLEGCRIRDKDGAD